CKDRVHGHSVSFLLHSHIRFSQIQGVGGKLFRWQPPSCLFHFEPVYSLQSTRLLTKYHHLYSLLTSSMFSINPGFPWLSILSIRSLSMRMKDSCLSAFK